MSVFFQRCLFLLLLVMLQHSWLDVMWPDFRAPGIIIAVVISLVYLLGFERGVGWALVATGMSLLIGEVNIFPVYAVGIAYGSGFLTRRLRIEHQTQHVFVLSLVAATAALMFVLILNVLQVGTVPFVNALGNAGITAVLFPLVFGSIRWRESQIERSLMLEFRSVRT